MSDSEKDSVGSYPRISDEQAYLDAVYAALEAVVSGLDAALEKGVAFKSPVPPTVAKVAIFHAMVMSAMLFGKDQKIPLAVMKDFLKSAVAMSVEIFPDLKAQNTTDGKE